MRPLSGITAAGVTPRVDRKAKLGGSRLVLLYHAYHCSF
ncbi:hypothetical protein DSM3645_03883 [Blastopirellula marina DSM 3645]|uniref:Uncharacterized protein n=1 Tax=Blastopirellula marina DSM 3645 TaxID=314230 RepID=A3ZV77_9BACT|nr:hypothetical protein DSM3645_03883 [Blastopirellula marina DSM 3645]